jgi:catechol 2,3-dioxygenase-like lactoylglutathione lyase family enzyme
MEACWVRGATVDCTLKLAVNRSGPIEIELIEVLEGDTPHSEHLRTHGDGLHHVRFRVSSLDAKLEALEREGFEVVFVKRFGPNVAFAYVETPPALGRSVIELLEMP